MLQNVSAFSVFQISESTWSSPLQDKLKSKDRFCEMSTADIQQKIELRTGSMSWTLRPLCYLQCNNRQMCSLFSPVPAVPRSWIRELSFRSRQLCLWGPLSWSLALQLVPPQQASSQREALPNCSHYLCRLSSQPCDHHVAIGYWEMQTEVDLLIYLCCRVAQEDLSGKANLQHLGVRILS